MSEDTGRIERLHNAVVTMDNKIEAFGLGLISVADVQMAHGEMLREILELLCAEPGQSPIEALIVELNVTLGMLVKQSRRTEVAVEKMTAQFGQAVIRGASTQP